MKVSYDYYGVTFKADDYRDQAWMDDFIKSAIESGVKFNGTIRVGFGPDCDDEFIDNIKLDKEGELSDYGLFEEVEICWDGTITFSKYGKSKNIK